MKHSNIPPIAVDKEDAARLVTLSVGTLERLVQQGDFPKPRLVSQRRVAWIVSELTEWLHNCPVSDLPPVANSGHRSARS